MCRLGPSCAKVTAADVTSSPSDFSASMSDQNKHSWSTSTLSQNTIIKMKKNCAAPMRKVLIVASSEKVKKIYHTGKERNH